MPTPTGIESRAAKTLSRVGSAALDDWVLESWLVGGILVKVVLPHPGKPSEILAKLGNPHNMPAPEQTLRKLRIKLEALAAAAAGRMWRAGFLKFTIACCC